MSKIFIMLLAINLLKTYIIIILLVIKIIQEILIVL